ncbi:MAG TPA: hypothetical protein VMB50_14260 [Myxococcales bacterium]|nr:hypothetical protein [Myxococcales bacterium]
MKTPLALLASLTLAAGLASAAEPGEISQTDALGMNVVTWNLTKGTTTTVANAQVLSEFVGAHYYVWRDVRLGLVLQFSEQLAPEVTAGSPFRTFALLPQVGWNVWGPFFVAGVLTIAPFSNGGANWTLGVQAVGGAAWTVAKWVKLTAAVEVPYNFYDAQTVGLTPIVGASFRL